MNAFVIAEAGVNHNGERDIALALVDAAADAGADAVKFQTFTADALVTEAAPKAAYQDVAVGAGESQLDMLRRLELPRAMYFQLAERCRERGIRFLSSPFDIDSLLFLTDEMKLDTVKIPSGEITNGPLLLAAGRSGADIILSTGASTLDEVEAALGVLAFGLTGSAVAPSPEAFAESFSGETGRTVMRERVTLLHCTTEYPAPVEDANLRAMKSMREAFGLAVGLSDHTAGVAVAVAAAAMGAAVIEKHFTLDRAMPGPDHKASLEPDRFADMIARIRRGGNGLDRVQSALGDGVKAPRPSEIRNRDIVRKSLVALKPIKAGEPFTEENLGAKRPGGGLSPMAYWSRLGTRAERDIAEGEAI